MSSDFLIERDEELRFLAGRMDDARDGAGCVLVIEGAPGAGKSAVLQAVSQSAGTSGFLVAASRASELEQEFPFGIVRQLFEPLMRRLAPAEREAAMEGAAQLAAPFVGLSN